MIRRVYEGASQANVLSEVIVATDDERIENEVNSFGGRCVMTSKAHQTGTDRCAEVLAKLTEPCDVVINIQGDEPYIQSEHIELVAELFQNDLVEIGTLAKKIQNTNDLFNPNKPKVIKEKSGKAIYFTRQALPYFRDKSENDWINGHTYFKHIGIYGYRSKTLEYVTTLSQSSLELAEGLEQLRWIENGIGIFVQETETEAFSVDTREDLENLLKQAHDN